MLPEQFADAYEDGPLRNIDHSANSGRPAALDSSQQADALVVADLGEVGRRQTLARMR
jgi:hypothetical protein